jgi:hypothetical protein
MTLYLITAFLWAIYAMKQQRKIHNKLIFFTGIINFLICPIAIIFAILIKRKTRIFTNGENKDAKS